MNEQMFQNYLYLLTSCCKVAWNNNCVDFDDYMMVANNIMNNVLEQTKPQ